MPRRKYDRPEWSKQKSREQVNARRVELIALKICFRCGVVSVEGEKFKTCANCRHKQAVARQKFLLRMYKVE